MASSNIPSIDKCEYIVDEYFNLSDGSALKSFTVNDGLYLIFVRGNASQSDTVPTITIRDNYTGVVVRQAGSAGGSVSTYKLVHFIGNASHEYTITVSVSNFTGGGSYNDYNRITILKLHN